MTDVRLRIYVGDALQRTFALERARTDFGRGELVAMRLDDPDVQLVHGTLHRKDEHVHLRALTPVWVGDRLVLEARLRHGDEMRVGPYRIVVEIVREPSRPTIPLTRELECPRCRRAIRQADEGAPHYREAAPVRARQCSSCNVTVFDVAELAERFRRSAVRLSGSAADRGHVATRSGCPGCFATIEEVTLSWGDRWLVLEECPRCGMLVLDEGELEMLGAMADTAPDPAEPAWARAARGAATLFESIFGKGS